METASSTLKTIDKLLHVAMGVILSLLISMAVLVLVSVFQPGPQRALAETEQGPAEEKVVRKASTWLGSKGLDRDLYLQCKADGECALTYTRAGVLHGATIRCYDKGCIAVSGW